MATHQAKELGPGAVGQRQHARHPLMREAEDHIADDRHRLADSAGAGSTQLAVLDDDLVDAFQTRVEPERAQRLHGGLQQLLVKALDRCRRARAGIVTWKKS